ncbi:gamma-glutamyltransferase [Aliidiomarina minuta]|uniref:Glutathione hydrolase proenzyme n=1 Tax=Aliidiomarina minuta TaxID=880057 RepID=A0A432W6Y6_9GAMM|nr:gamma-glutamyltransferase [Aliidiomarina minuta]RUO25781.1 gamma-glutamyltransferase [Aliidiomarina minuta]
MLFFRSPAFCVLVLTFSIIGCSPQTEEIEAYEPEAATGFQQHQLEQAEHYMVAAANGYAVESGLNVLAQGGNAIDAAIAVQAMLTLVEPQSSGIGGGAFILYWDAAEKELHTLDARETAPAAASADLFLDAEGEPVPWIDAVVGGRSVGTPGLLHGLDMAHQRWGRLPWDSLFDDAIVQAEQGFMVSPRLQQLLEMDINPGVRQLTTTRNYFFPDGSALQAGDVKRNPELASSLRKVANEGIDVFYRGELGSDLVAAVQNAEIAPGVLTTEDLSKYEATWREPVCSDYRSHQVCSMGPPSSGGITLLQTLKMLQGFELSEYDINSSQPWHWFTQASRLAFADRDRYLADSDFVEVPVEQLLDAEYLRHRAQLIGDEDMGPAEAGIFSGYAEEVAGVIQYEQPNTTQISIVDAEGNAVSMTSTIEMGFGSSVMSNGFLLNNQLTDFDFQPQTETGLAANRIEPGKRPRSSMSPVMVFDGDQSLRHVLGSPGGPRIINYVTQTVMALIDWELDIQSAINLPKVTNLNGQTAIEEDVAPEFWADEFRQRGHQLQVRPLNSGLHGITIESSGLLYGGADPRREGVAKGQ